MTPPTPPPKERKKECTCNTQKFWIQADLGPRCTNCGWYEGLEDDDLSSLSSLEIDLKKLATPVFQGELRQGIYGDLYDPEKLLSLL